MNVHWRPGFALCTAAVTIIGCGPGGEASGIEEETAWGDSLVLVEEMRIGSLEGDPSTSFGRITAIAPGRDETVYVADGHVPTIGHFDSGGRYIGEVGAEGDGPGEYRSVDGLAVSEAGMLRVWDSQSRRLSSFDASGTFQWSVTVPQGRGGPIRASSGGTVLVPTVPDGPRGTLPNGQVVRLTETARIEWVRVDSTGVRESVATTPEPATTGPRFVLEGRGGPYRPFSIETVSAIGPDGSLFWARNDEYVIYRRSPTGDTTRIVRDDTRVELTPEEVAQWSEFADFFQGRSRNGNLLGELPDVKPFIRRLTVDDDDRLWVSRYTEPVFFQYPEGEVARRRRNGAPLYEWRDQAAWDVFDAEGGSLGRVTLPLNTTFVTAQHRDVWGITSGQLREDYIIRWTLTPVPSD